MNDISTKVKILNVAKALFGEKGLNAVSIREIATACDVNVAAVNYHFSNKEKLYLETVKQSMQQTFDDIKVIFESIGCENLETLMIETFNSFIENEEDCKSCGRLILGMDGFHEELALDLARFNGPPGGEFFAKCMRREFPQADEAKIQSSVRILFTHLIHTSMIMNNPQIRDALTRSGADKEVMMDDIKRLVRLIQSDLV